MYQPREVYWTAALRIPAYVKSSPGKSLLYKKREHIRIFGYSDSGYDCDKRDRKPTTSYCTFIGENLITWRRKKQDVFRSSVEAEYRVITHAACKMIRLKNLLLELDFRQSGPMHMFCDSQSAIYIAQNLVFYERTKYIEVDSHLVDCHLVRDVWTKKVVLSHLLHQDSWRIFSLKQLHQRCFLSYIASWTWLISMLQLEGKC